MELVLDEGQYPDKGLDPPPSSGGAAAAAAAAGGAWPPLAGPVQQLLAQSIALNSTALLAYSPATGTLERSGNRTECALLELSMRMQWQAGASASQLRSAQPVLRLLPFSSLRKRMTAVVQLPHAPPAPKWAAGTGPGGGSLASSMDADDLSLDGLVVASAAAPGGPSAAASRLLRPGASSGSGTSSSGDGGSEDNLGAAPPVSRARVLTKGAAELVLDRCTRQLGPDGAVLPLAAAQRNELLRSFSGAGALRLLALAYRDIDLPATTTQAASAHRQLEGGAEEASSRRAFASPPDAGGSNASVATMTMADLPITTAEGIDDMDEDELEQDLTLVAVVGLQDPLRPDVPSAVKQCTRAGIAVRMITGDNAFTAASIAQQCGILPPSSNLEELMAACSRLQRTPPGSSSALGGGRRGSDAVAASPLADAAGDDLASALSVEPAEGRARALLLQRRGSGSGRGDEGSRGAGSSTDGYGSYLPATWGDGEAASLDASTDGSTTDTNGKRGLEAEGAAAAASVPVEPPPSSSQQQQPRRPAAGSGSASASSSVGTGSSSLSVSSAESMSTLSSMELALASLDGGYNGRAEVLPAPLPQRLFKDLPAHLVLEGSQFRRLVQRAGPDQGDGASPSQDAGAGGGGGGLDREAFLELWPRLRVLARCSPSDKYLLVMAIKQLRAEGRLQEVVAMTGDGTNDAPALTAADVGFAMNSGTPIARDAADILLLDDSFSSIVAAVMWGRNVYSSISKFLQFQLTANVVAVVTACVGAVALQQSPLSAVQMLWVNLIMDSLASLALATEAPTDAVLDLPPCRPDQPLISPTVAKHIAGQAAFQLAVLAALLAAHQSSGGGSGAEADAAASAASTAAAAVAAHPWELLPQAGLWLQQQVLGPAGGPGGAGGAALRNTMVFNSFVMMQLFNQVNCRRVRDEPDVLAGLLQHPLFLAIVASEAVMQVVIVQFGGPAFQTVPLNGPQWTLCVGVGALTLLVRAALRLVPVGEEDDKDGARGGGGDGPGGPTATSAAASS